MSNVRKAKSILKLLTFRNFVMGYALVVSSVALFLAWSQFEMARIQNQSFAEQTFRELVAEGAESIYKDPTSIPKENKLYIPEARINIDLTRVTADMKYSYSPQAKEAGYESPEAIILTTRQSLGALRTTTPQRQDSTCVNLVELTFNAKSTNEQQFRFHSEAKLRDGRTMYIHTPVDGGCGLYWLPVIPDEIAAAMKTAQSY